MPGWLIGLLIGGVGIVFVIGIMSVLAISGTRKYIANAKQAEARNSLGQIARDAVAAYEMEDPLATGAAPIHKLCKSASHPVPASMSSVRGVKYMASPGEWTSDPKDAGFTCLKFEMMTPQYYAYDYKASKTGFKALASGDLNGDGHASHFEIEGQITPGDIVTIAPSILETDPDE
jgi:type IV pilus assembly protein PilA